MRLMGKSSKYRVPRLNLAPKIGRPLRWWHPFDYLLLLYWVFFFPQALRRYLKDIPEVGGRVDQNSQTKFLVLLVQGIVLTSILTLISLAGSLWKGTADPTEVLSGMVLGVASGMASSLGWGVGFVMAPNLASQVVLGVFLGVAWRLLVGVALVEVSPENLRQYIDPAMMVGVAVGLAWTMAWRTASREALGMSTSRVAEGKVSGLASGLAWAVAVGWALNWQAGLIWTGALFWVIFRPEDWLLGLYFVLGKPSYLYWSFLHVTRLPMPYLAERLMLWLRGDWEVGLHNLRQILTYTYQFPSVVRALKCVLAQTPSSQIISCVAQVAEHLGDWTLLHLVANNLSKHRKHQIPASVVNGFCSLHHKNPLAAAQTFNRVKDIAYGEEMCNLAQTLANFDHAQDVEAIANLNTTIINPENALRQETWQVIKNLCRVIENVRVVHGSVSRSTRSFAHSRALGEIKTILSNSFLLPELERNLIISIAENWQDALLCIASEVGDITINKPVRNPYIVGDPVENNLFVGRDEVIRQLEELWVYGQQLQSVVFYGHRRMGKTSILRHVSHWSNSEVKVVYVNLQSLGEVTQGCGEVLMAITDEIAEAIGIAPPADEELLNLPQLTFKRYLKKILAQTNPQGLIIALDEFEVIEELIEQGQIPTGFMSFLRGLVQMSPKIAFAFAGLHTLEEMTADYFQPFFASVISIHVSFLKLAATRQILANPGDDFPLDYTGKALDKIHQLTAGQPYLVQRVGFQLVRRYNDQVFEQGHSHEAVFTLEDVEAVIGDPEFFQKGRFYFEGVWNQAAQGATGQQELITIIANYPQGLSHQNLATASKLDETLFSEALQTLIRHDVVTEVEGKLQIIVELFRRWVLQVVSQP